MAPNHNSGNSSSLLMVSRRSSAAIINRYAPKSPILRLLVALVAASTVFVFLFSHAVLLPKHGGKAAKVRKKIALEDEPDPFGLASYKLVPSHRHRLSKRGASAATVATAIAKQIENPYTHSKTSKRTFGCIRDECRGLAMEDLTDRKWRMMYKSSRDPETHQLRTGQTLKMTLVLTDGTELTKLEKRDPQAYLALSKEQEGRTYVEAVEGADAIGGNKGQQLRTKQRFVHKRRAPNDTSVCTYASLGLQPQQYRLYVKDECDAFYKIASKSGSSSFLLKPETGSQGQGITYHASAASVAKKVPQFFPCTENLTINAVDRYLVQDYILKPLLVRKSKFDARVYLLVASTTPWIVFYREGYLRRSLFPYTPGSKDRAVILTNTHLQSMKEGFKLSDHIWTLVALQNYLTKTGYTGAHYVDAVLEPYLHRVGNFVFQSAKSKLVKRKGSYHVFGLDFMIDEKLRVHFIEANGFPGYTWSLNYDSRGLVTDLMDLVLELHEAPAVFERMKAGDTYGGFQMIYSEIEEQLNGDVYDPCYEFYNNDKAFANVRSSMRNFAKYAGYSTSRILKHDAEEEDDDEGDDGSGVACAKANSKMCKAKRKLAAKEAAKAKTFVDRAFENLGDVVEGSAPLIGGLKSSHFQTLSEYMSQSQKCSQSWNLLGVSPAVYEWPKDCAKIEKYKTSSRWLIKPDDHRLPGDAPRVAPHQRSIVGSFGGTSCLSFSSAKTTHLVQRVVDDVLTLDGAPWSLKAYMLIASVKPFFVFYHPGFARTLPYEVASPVSGVHEPQVLEDQTSDGSEEEEEEGGSFSASSESHARRDEAFASAPQYEQRDLSLEDWQHFVSFQRVAGAKFFQTHVETFMKRTMELVYRASRDKLVARGKVHQIFELDFIVDSKLRVWYTGSTASPKYSASLGIREEMRGDLRTLALELAEDPEAFAQMRVGNGYGSFRLIASDFTDVFATGEPGKTTFNPCRDFHKKWSLPRSVAAKAAELHDVIGRSTAANERELRKYVHGKWSQCRAKGRLAATCAQQVRKFVTDRYRLFLKKERTKDVSEAAIVEWVDEKLMELAGEGVALPGVNTKAEAGGGESA